MTVTITLIGRHFGSATAQAEQRLLQRRIDAMVEQVTGAFFQQPRGRPYSPDTAGLETGWMTATEVRAAELDQALLECSYPNPFREYGEAEARGEKLLREWLSPAQAAQYDTNGWFEVTGGETGRRYRIKRGRAVNIEELDQEGKKLCDWCFVPSGTLATGDVMLAQKIALESDERAALAVANRFETEDWSMVRGTPYMGPREVLYAEAFAGLSEAMMAATESFQRSAECAGELETVLRLAGVRIDPARVCPRRDVRGPR